MNTNKSKESSNINEANTSDPEFVPVLNCFVADGNEIIRETMITMAMVAMTTKIRYDNHKQF